jgi:hypothetical protein
MKTKLFVVMLCVLVLASVSANAQMMKRTDAVWARTTTSAITLDGKLTEAAWATADSVKVQMGKDNGLIPGSGWYWENGKKFTPDDPTNATIKFLAKGDSLYLGVVCKDKSIGAGLFNQFDGFLINLRYKGATGYLGNPYRNRMDQASEIFYGWVSETWADTSTAFPGASPACLGDWSSAYVHPRPDSLKAFWDAVTTVQGTVNSDAGNPDTSYTTEFKFNLKKFNYNPSQTGGDIAMLGIQIYDGDYEWPLDTLKQSGNRVWFQSPWGNASAFNHIRVFIDPAVTTGTLPVVAADYTIPDGKNYATPVVDGRLTEDVWKYAPSLKMKFGDATIRNAYANTAKYRSGQYQPTVNGAQNAVLDANLASVKYFFKADTLYLGFDVPDKFVQAVNDYDRWDGFRVIMVQRDARNGDSVLQRRRLTFRIDSAGVVKREDDLSSNTGSWDSAQVAVKVGLGLKGGTTVDTLGASPDSGYTAEMKIDLRKFGYPAGRGDGVVFLAICGFDGDSFTGGSYGTRTWFMAEGDWNDGSAWFYMDPASVVTDVADAAGEVPGEFALLGNYPNPFNPSTSIRFQMAQRSEVTLAVYDVLGRLVSESSLGVRAAGQHTVPFNAASLASGSYFYRLQMMTTGHTLLGKMLLLK